ncbi:DUF3152 domain-containing protein [Streptomyces sp. NPDC006284]|uniref:DUF3152 domain-containing protein n=1 Tax=unclassified Streptomyces TaxID=2593676 RepID=UPI0033BF2ACB
MNAHRSSSSPASERVPRRRGGGRSRRRRGGPPLLRAGLVAGVVLLVAGGLVLREPTEPSGRSADAAGRPAASEPPASREVVETDGARGEGRTAEDRQRVEVVEDGTETETGSDAGSIPSAGPGTFATAPGDGARVGGRERTLTYVVQVEDGIGIPAEDVATEVERVLADERGWTADRKVGFRRVSGGASDFRVRLATAGTVDEICGRYGLDTGGEVNCNVGQDVMVNLKRWLLATRYYADDVPSYRALIVNHEVGHFLGHGHVGCPGAGRPAPVMMQQIKGLHGCRTNVWPYDAEGRLVTGPARG